MPAAPRSGRVGDVEPRRRRGRQSASRPQGPVRARARAAGRGRSRMDGPARTAAWRPGPGPSRAHRRARGQEYVSAVALVGPIGAGRAGSRSPLIACRRSAADPLRSPPRRQRGDGGALGIAASACGSWPGRAPTARRCARQADLPRPGTPRGDRVGVRGVAGEAPQAGHRGGPGQLAALRQAGDGAAPEDEEHAQRVVRHGAASVTVRVGLGPVHRLVAARPRRRGDEQRARAAPRG